MSGEIFLSYAGLDRELATRLKDGLQLAGLEDRVWQDIDQIRGGDNWLKKLDEALQAGAGYLILVGPGGIHHWVKFELYAAVRRHYDTDERFPILPVLLPGASPEHLPSFLSLFQAERLPTEPSAADYRRLADRLHVLLAAAPAADDGGSNRPLLAESPWPGLAAYNESQQRFFFGRSTETLEALRKFGNCADGVYRRWLQVEGQSGVGKSSLVHAGLVPEIRHGWLGESEVSLPSTWRVAGMRPGSEPLTALAVALAGLREDWRSDPSRLITLLNQNDPDTLKLQLRLAAEATAPPRQRVLLVIDQFEEVFAPLVTEEERASFDRVLAAALADRDGPLHLITTIRSDFTLQQQQTMPRLCALINEQAGRHTVLRISDTGLEEIVRNPARLAGLEWDETTLPERIVEEAMQTPNPLPLLGYLLWRMWDKRQGRKLLASVHRELGGVGGALAKSAETLWQSLDADSQLRARGLLLKLVSIGPDRADTRRTISRTVALQAAGGGFRAEAVLLRLSSGSGSDANQGINPRLIFVGKSDQPDTSASKSGTSARQPDVSEARPDDPVDLAHEALLTRWDLMRSWLVDANTRRQLEAEDALEEAARRWRDDGSPARPGLPEPRVWARYRKANAPSTLAERYLVVLRIEHRWRRFKQATIAASFLVLFGGFLTLDIWANRHGASRTLALRALAMRLGLSAPPPIPPMVDSPAGSFQMGSSLNGVYSSPRHLVILGAFRLGRYETTYVEYDAFAETFARGDFNCPDRHRVDPPDDEGWGRGRRPVLNVSWEDATCYAAWLSFMTGQTYRLPSEAEWEYAARAGTDTPFWWGKDFEPGKAVCDGCDSRFAGREQGKQTAEVDDAAFQPNLWGLYHTDGNVWEWVRDCFRDSYEGVPQDGAAVEDPACRNRVMRGGSWGSTQSELELDYRFSFHPDYRGTKIGFRLAQDLK